MLMVDEWIKVISIGIGATVVMDIGAIIQRALNMPTLNYALVGRWIGHMYHGQWSHHNIGKAPAIVNESALGWGIHYLTGIVFAALLVVTEGMAWVETPTLLPAVLVGIITTVVPFFVMQPAMGAGIAASRTPTPWINRLRSLLNHAIFGVGLYLSAQLIALFWQ